MSQARHVEQFVVAPHLIRHRCGSPCSIMLVLCRARGTGPYSCLAPRAGLADVAERRLTWPGAYAVRSGKGDVTGRGHGGWGGLNRAGEPAAARQHAHLFEGAAGTVDAGGVRLRRRPSARPGRCALPRGPGPMQPAERLANGCRQTPQRGHSPQRAALSLTGRRRRSIASPSARRAAPRAQS